MGCLGCIGVNLGQPRGSSLGCLGCTPIGAPHQPQSFSTQSVNRPNSTPVGVTPSSTRVRRRKPFHRTWYTALLTGPELTLRRGARHVSVDPDTLDETVTVDARKLPFVNVGDKLVLCRGDEFAMVEVIAMERTDACTVRVLTGQVSDGPVQWLSAGRAKHTRRRVSRPVSRDESVVRHLREGRAPERSGGSV